ncbi:MAG: acylneuraminate cytidylyltransferase family protein [Rhodospirillaceae bacterium]
MSKALRILFLIAARGGSKGVRGKNLKSIAGLSLLGYKARSAQSCSNCSRLILSTDSEEIRAEGQRLGVEVPFIRPAELATDDAPSDGVVSHAMEWVEADEGRSYDAVMLLEPSSPFATAEHYDEAIRLFKRNSADLVVGLRNTETYSLFTGRLGANGSIASIVEKMSSETALRRQDQPIEVTMNGAFYLVGWNAFRRSGKIYGDPSRCFGVMMDWWHSIEIETPANLAMAEFAVAQGYLDVSLWSDTSEKNIPPRNAHP